MVNKRINTHQTKYQYAQDKLPTYFLQMCVIIEGLEAH